MLIYFYYLLFTDDNNNEKYTKIVNHNLAPYFINSITDPVFKVIQNAFEQLLIFYDSFNFMCPQFALRLLKRP